jgi:hypothetical protein
MNPLMKSMVGACLFMAFAVGASAQALPNLGPERNIAIELSPEYPQPGQPVTATVKSYVADAQSADIVWEVDGKPFKQGMGVTSITLTAGAKGMRTDIRVLMVYNDRQFLAESSFVPAGVNLLWEGVGYTPPFYKGKTLVTYGGVIKVIAIPEFYSSNGALVPRDRLIYNWEKNGKLLLGASGVGKSSVKVYQDSLLRGEEVVTVEIRDPETNAITRSSISVTPRKSIVALYEESPALGRLYNRALSGRYTLNKQELTLMAEPFFMTLAGRDDRAATYRWKQNGFLLVNDARSSITIQNAGPEAAASVISVDTSSNAFMLQGGSSAFTLGFAATVDTSEDANPFTDEN